jgi:hypothetical protein
MVVATSSAVACDADIPRAPSIDCSPVVFETPAQLGCEAAIAVALRRLGPGHPPIERIRFEYGRPCRETIACRFEGGGAIGWVGIEFRAAGAPDYIVGVQVDRDGRVTQRTRPLPEQPQT